MLKLNLLLITSAVLLLSPIDSLGQSADKAKELDVEEQTNPAGLLDPLEAIQQFEGLVGSYTPEILERFGQPDSVTSEHLDIEEREAELWYYKWAIEGAEKAHLRFAIQNDRVVGAEMLDTEQEDVLYSAARYHVALNGSTWTPSTGIEERLGAKGLYGARKGDLFWGIHYLQTPVGRAGVIRVGTVKYMTCDLAWETEGLRGTDGFGNPLKKNDQEDSQ